MKILYNTETGETTVQESRPSGMRVSPSVEQASARNAHGMPVSLANVKPGDVVSLPGMGDSTAAVYESMGLLRRLPGGMGYEVIGQEPAAQEQPKQDNTPKADESPAGDPTGVEPTSLKTDQTLSAIESKSPAALEGLITSLSQTGEVSPAIIADMARTHGVEPAQMQADVDALVADHTRAARQAIARVDSSIDPDLFTAWLLKSPEMADRVTRDVMGKSVREVQNAARAYVTSRQTALREALEGHGLNVWEDHGSLFVTDFPGAGKKNVSVRELVERGLLDIRG